MFHINFHTVNILILCIIIKKKREAEIENMLIFTANILNYLNEFYVYKFILSNISEYLCWHKTNSMLRSYLMKYSIEIN